MKKVLYVGTALLLLMLLADKSYCLDIMNLRDQSTLRCPRGIVARGDSEINVQRRCGDPLKIALGKIPAPFGYIIFAGGDSCIT